MQLWTDTDRTTLINIPIFTHNGRYHADLHPQRLAGCAARTDIPLLHFPTWICPSVPVWRAMVIGKGILGAGRYFGFQIQSLRDLVAASRRNHFAWAEPIVYRPDAERDLPLLPPYTWIQIFRRAYLCDGYGGIYFRAGKNGWPANRIADFASDIWKTPLFIERVGCPMEWSCWKNAANWISNIILHGQQVAVRQWSQTPWNNPAKEVSHPSISTFKY